MRVRAGLIDEDIAPGETVPIRPGKAARKRHRLQILFAGRIVADRLLQPEMTDDVVGPIAIVHIAVQDTDPPGRARPQHRQGRDHQAIKGAEAPAKVIAGMMEARHRRAGHAPRRQGFPVAATRAPLV